MADNPMDGDQGVPVDLHDDGLLWLINRAVFHPRGFALGHGDGDSFVLLGDGTEAWQYAPPVEEDDLLRRAEAAFDRARGAHRGD